MSLDKLYDELCVGTEYEAKRKPFAGNPTKGVKAQHDYSRLLLDAIQLNKENRPCGAPGSMATNAHYFYYHCTVRLNLGRGLGATTYILSHCKGFDIVVVPTLTVKDQLMRLVRQHGCLLDRSRVMIASELEEKLRGVNDIEDVWVDHTDSSFPTREALLKMYIACGRDWSQTFILL